MAKLKLNVKRWCGEVRIKLGFNDKTDNWEVRVTTKDGSRRVYINCITWWSSGKAVDTSAAYDYAAAKAITFSCEDDESTDKTICTEEYASFNLNGEPHIGRTFHTAFFVKQQQLGKGTMRQGTFGKKLKV